MQDQVSQTAASAHRASEVISRLALREDTRKADLQRAKIADREEDNAAESEEAFLCNWQARAEAARAEAAELKASPCAKRLEELTSRVSILDKDATAATFFLSTYHAQHLSTEIQALRHSLDALRTAAMPKKKFSFARKVATKPAAPSDSRGANQSEAGPGPSSKALSQPLTAPDRCLRGHTKQVVIKDAAKLAGGDFLLEDLQGCTVYLLGQLSAIRAHRLTDCQIFTGPVTGAVFFERIQDCTLSLAAAQFRMHQASNTDIYLRVRSKPIIEDCTELRFAPYNQLQCKVIQQLLHDSNLAEETGNWAEVQDFDWLRASPSPNWRVMEVADRQSMPDLPVS